MTGYALLLVAHIAVLGYWLGSELVINSEYRLVCHRGDLPLVARDAVMGHVMEVDQHVRYALILQLALGGMLAAMLGLVPRAGLWLAPLAGGVWLVLVEIVHRRRADAFGRQLAAFDRGLRYAVLAALLVVAGVSDLPVWLRLKLALFAGVVGCGVGIRFALIRHFAVWQAMLDGGESEASNAAIRAVYLRATAILILLWLLIAAIVAISIARHGLIGQPDGLTTPSHEVITSSR